MDLEHLSIERIKIASEMSMHYYGLPLVSTYSGGKDSDVMLELFRRSGVPFEVINGHTTVDAPPTVYHIRDVFRDLEAQGIRATIHKPQMTMWQLIEKKKTPPSRLKRYCCEKLKENVVKNRFVSTGVRWAESERRKNRKEIEPKGKKNAERIMLMNDNDRKRVLTEHCAAKSDMILNPILDWTDTEIWDFYWSECKRHNPLYSMGYYRVGCIGCPMAGKHRWKEFADFPTYRRAYTRAFGKMLDAIHASGKPTKWKNAEEVFLWWMEDENVEGQMDIYSYPEVIPGKEKGGRNERTKNRSAL